MDSIGHRQNLNQITDEILCKKKIYERIQAQYAYLLRIENTFILGYEKQNQILRGIPLENFHQIKPADQYNTTYKYRNCQVCHEREKQPLKDEKHKTLNACKNCHEDLKNTFNQLIENTDNIKLTTNLI